MVDALTELQKYIRDVKHGPTGMSRSNHDHDQENKSLREISHDNRLNKLEEIVVNNDLKLKITMNTVIRQEAKIEELEEKLVQDHRSSVRGNIIIEGILEDRQESRKQLFENVDKFFKELLEIPNHIKILDAYRMGNTNWSNRQVKVKLMHLSDKAIIFANASKLKGKKNAKKRLFHQRRPGCRTVRNPEVLPRFVAGK